nr:membrane-bound alpha-1,6- mannosyltransferase Initiation-specific [Polyrhizophydium stewartii]
MTSSFTSCGAPSEHAAILPVVLGSQQSGLPDWAMALIRGSELDLNAGLASNAWRRAFAQFLTKEFCTESLLFVRAVDCFKETADDALFPSVAERDAASIRRANFIAAHFLVEAPNRLLTLDLDEGIEPDPANAGRTTSAVLNAAEAALEAHLGSPVAQTRPIPRMIHQQWKSALVPESHTAWVTAFRKIEGYTHLLWTDADLAVFVRKYFPRHEKLYHALPKPILRADLARYMLLYVFGGIYSDLDTSPIKHPDLWLEHRTPTAGRSNESTSGSRFDDEPVRLVVGIEADSPRWRSMCFARRVQFCQWTMASVPRHPALQRILRLALSMLDHLIGLGRSGSKPINDSAACVEHHFAGSWKDGLSSVRCFLGILE